MGLPPVLDKAKGYKFVCLVNLNNPNISLLTHDIRSFLRCHVLYFTMNFDSFSDADVTIWSYIAWPQTLLAIMKEQFQ